MKDLLTPDPTPDRQLTHPSGWCMTLTHEFCPYQFNHGKCGCDCHLKPKSVPKKRNSASTDNKTQKTQAPREEVAVVADSSDPRPWKR